MADPPPRSRRSGEPADGRPFKHPRGLNNPFFKTRLCGKFAQNCCPYGPACSFAHGAADLRRPPPNWPDLAAGERPPPPRNSRLCRKFYTTGECSYGERCTFLHERRLQESSAISVTDGRGRDDFAVSCGGGDGDGPHRRTKMCHKWEVSGSCSFGDACHFAHGYAEIKKFGGHLEFGNANVGAAPSKPLSHPSDDDPLSNGDENVGRQKSYLKWKDPKKIAKIYADWIDEPLSHLPK